MTVKKNIETDQAKGIEFSRDGKILVKYPNDLKDESYVIPEGVESIGKNAFDNVEVQHVTFPKSLKRIEKEAFVWAGIRKAVLPEGLEEIGAAAFWCCPNLTEVSIPRSVTEIGEYAFYGCRALKKIVTFWDEPQDYVMAWRNLENYYDEDLRQPGGEAPSSLFCHPRVFSGCEKLLDVTGCEAFKALVAEYQHRAVNPLPEDDPDCPKDYQFDDGW